MKQSWIVGVMMAWLLIFGLEMLVTGGTAFNSEEEEQMENIVGLEITNQSGFTSSLSWVSNVGKVLKTFLSAVFLWSPSVFSGWAQWIWVMVCFPVSVAFVVTLALAARGVGSS